jgi:hypothetical protein
VKLGTSFTELIVIVKVWVGLSSTPPLAVPPSSVAFSVIVADPFWFAPAVNESVPFAVTLGPAANRLGSVLSVMTRETVWPDSFAGPALIPVAQPLIVCAPESSSNVGFAPLVKLGASFTEVTTIWKVWVALVSTPPFAVPPSSCRRRVIVAEPKAFATGV